MDELIIMKNDITVLNADISNTLMEIENQIKVLKEKEDLIKQHLLEEMENRNILKLEDNNIAINYIAPSDRETFDSKKFKSEHQDLYDEYVKMTPIKSSIRIKVKNE